MASRSRRWRSLIGAAVAVAVCALAFQFQPVAVAAASYPATLWGIDSCDSATSVVPIAETVGMGTPAFIGRYLGSNRCGTNGLSAAEVSFLASNGVSILLIADADGFNTSSVQAETAQGTSEAQTAIQQAHTLGAPPGTAIFRDVEIYDGISTPYIESWYQAFADSGSGYVPGFYENSYNTAGPFAGTSGAWCSAVAAEPALANGVALWTNEFEPYYWYPGQQPPYFPIAGNAPPWDPADETPYPLPCANTTVAWQYEINSGFPVPNNDPNVDVDEFLSAYSSLLWGGGAYAPLGSAGAYTPLTPYRICDTRVGTGTGCSGHPIGPGGTVSMFIAGVTGPQGQLVPADAQEVVLNVTAIGPTQATFLTVYPTGAALPGTSNINVLAGDIVANLAVVPLGDAGQVSIYSPYGRVDVAVDVVGYFAAASGTSAPGLFHAIAPLRICDTRPSSGTGCASTPLGVNSWTKITVGGLPAGAAAGTASVPTNGTAEAVALNLTAVSGTQQSFLSVTSPNSADACPTSPPAYSNVNVWPFETRPNRVITRLGPNADVCVYNMQGSINAILDVNGWFGTGAETLAGAHFYAIAPTRICDTRIASLGFATECSGNPLGPGQSMTVQVSGVDGLPASGGSSPPVAVLANLTAVSGTSPTFLTAYPDGDALPLASDVNAWTGQVIPNLTIVQLATSGSHPGAFDLYNLYGTINAVVDVQGWFE